MYEAKNKYEEYKEKDEIKYHLPEWFRILKEYVIKNYNENYLPKPRLKKNKKKYVEDLL